VKSGCGTDSTGGSNVDPIAAMRQTMRRRTGARGGCESSLAGVGALSNTFSRGLGATNISEPGARRRIECFGAASTGTKSIRIIQVEQKFQEEHSRGVDLVSTAAISKVEKGTRSLEKKK
jgi:hypothetical protein